MTRDAIVFAGLVVAFAVLVTAHVTLSFALARRPPRWRGLAALIVAPLAPWWAFRERMRVRGVLWVAAAVAYATLLGLALDAK
jgi:hypothetical protein